MMGVAAVIKINCADTAVIPVNYTGDFLEESGATGNDTTTGNLTYVFLKMSMSNVDNGSSLLWIHLVFLAMLVFYGCFLIVVFYEENVSMQHTLFKKYVDGMKTSNVSDLEERYKDPDSPDAQDDDSSDAQGQSEEKKIEYIEEGGMNERVVNMLNPENQTLLAQAFRQTVAEPEPGKLWPVRRPQRYTAERPQFAGKYAVLVIDEPRKKFATSKLVRFGAASKTATSGSALKSLWYALKLPFMGTKAPENGSSRHVEKTVDVDSHATNLITSASKKHQLEGVRNRKAKTSCCGLVKENLQKTEEKICERHERFHYIKDTFVRIYGDDFDQIIPIYDTEELDAKIVVLYNTQAQIERVKLKLANLQKSDKEKKRTSKLESKLKKMEEKECALQQVVEETRKEILDGPPRPTFIATFHSPLAAAAASNINANPISWRGFHTMPCPDPENINFPALSRTWHGRSVRYGISLFFIVLVMIFPLGIFTGAFSQLGNAICSGNPNSTASVSGSWICSDNFWAKLLMSIITGMLPQLLMTIYQSVFLPIYIMFVSQAEGRHVSLSLLDLRCAQLFFHWTVWNFFFGALLGGTVFGGLRSAVDDPSRIIDILGTAIPAASNFFINYVILRALTMTFFRLFYPHACVGMNIAQWFRVMPRTFFFFLFP